MKRALLLPVLLCAATAVAAVALAGPTADPGVSDTEVVLGGTAPLSGEASTAAAVAKGAEAYFKYVNDQGGVNQRKIEYKVLDDGYEPARSVTAARQLVQQDRVFALFNTLGTSGNLAIRDFLNQSEVPQLFVASGATTFGADLKKYPWTIGYIPSYLTEGIVLARTILKTKPKAKIAVLYQDDEYGNDVLAGFKKGLGKRANMIVKAVGYDPTGANVDSQIAQLRASKADTLMNIAFGKFAIQAFIQANKLGWRPQVYVNAVASSRTILRLAELAGAKAVADNTISIVYFKDPSDPKWAKDPGIKLFQTILRKYCCSSAIDLTNGYYIAGMAAAFTMVDTLRKAGRDLSRASLMAAARSLNEANNPFVLPGIVIKTGATDGFPMEQVGLQRWSKSHWNVFGGLLSAAG